MKSHILVVVVTLFGVSSIPAAAQIRLDMNQVTCRNYLEYSPEDREFIRFWMSGYSQYSTRLDKALS